MPSDSLIQLGWKPFFQDQLDPGSVDTPARVVEQHKISVDLEGGAGAVNAPLLNSTPPLCVGDWVLLNGERRISAVLDRTSAFRRKAAGHRVDEQLIAANVDTAFIVCSLNHDFNLNRIERYLSMVNEAGVEPVVVLSKADLWGDPERFRDVVRALDSGLRVETVNGLDPESVEKLRLWCGPGGTVALLGSSGSGKSTLTNTLLGEERQETFDIRENDSHGRHTTTRRTLIPIPGGGLIMDTPGMRELQLADCGTGVAETFGDIVERISHCRFGNCQHGTEPGCAVNEALESGELDQRRYANYLKLMREQSRNAADLATRRSRERRGKYKRIKAR